MVSFELFCFESPMILRSTGVTLTSGLIRSLKTALQLLLSAAAAKSDMDRGGQNSQKVFQQCCLHQLRAAHHSDDMTPDSVAASIGPRAISTVDVSQFPEVLPASFASLR
jgi:hypothetical protein